MLKNSFLQTLTIFTILLQSNSKIFYTNSEDVKIIKRPFQILPIDIRTISRKVRKYFSLPAARFFYSLFFFLDRILYNLLYIPGHA